MLRTRKQVSPTQNISLTTRGLIGGCNEELWNIFHNELDLDSNGHLDADELAVALRKAGERVLVLVCRLFSVKHRRGTSVSVDAVQLYDLPHVISPLALDKL